MRKNSFNYCVPRGSSTNLVKFVVYNKIFVFIYLWLVGVEHFQSLVEIIDDGLAPRIGALNNDTYVVVGVFVAYATEKDGELLCMVVLLKPALEKQAALALPPVAGIADVEATEALTRKNSMSIAITVCLTLVSRSARTCRTLLM